MAGAAATPIMFPGVQPPPPFIRQVQSPVLLPRFPVIDGSAIQNNPGLVCQNPVQSQVFPDRFGRYVGLFPRMQGTSQVRLIRYVVKYI